MLKIIKKHPTLCLFLSILSSLTLITYSVSAVSNELLDYFSTIDSFYWNPSGSGGSGCYNGTIGIAGSTAEEKIWSGLTSFMTPEQAAGVMGNMAHEGNYFNPLQHEGSFSSAWRNGFDIFNDASKSYGIGLIQWSGGRRVNMLNYVRENAPELIPYFEDPDTYGRFDYTINGDVLIGIIGEDLYDSLIKIELEYLQKELQDYPNSYGKLYDQGSVQSAADFFLEHVEIPGDIEGTRPDRRRDAQKYYDKYNGVLLSPSGGCAGGLVSGGMTYDEAYAFVKTYVDDPSECENWSNICYIYGKASEGRVGEPGANCVTFSQYFLNKYTTLGLISPMGNGGDVVSNLINNHGLADGGTTPRPYAIFSTRSPKWSSAWCDDAHTIRCGHTGVVLGIDESAGKIYIGQMAYGSYKSWGLTRIEYDLSEYSNGDFTYAYTDEFLKI